MQESLLAIIIKSQSKKIFEDECKPFVIEPTPVESCPMGLPINKKALQMQGFT